MRCAADQMAEIAHLPGLVDVGRPDADVTLYQFYDLNCPFCREAAADVDTLIRSDPRLRLVFVPYAVLSAAVGRGRAGRACAARSSARRSSSWNSTGASMPAAAGSTAIARSPSRSRWGSIAGR